MQNQADRQLEELRERLKLKTKRYWESRRKHDQISTQRITAMTNKGDRLKCPICDTELEVLYEGNYLYFECPSCGLDGVIYALDTKIETERQGNPRHAS